jgi:hypothetical protein
LLKIAKLKRSGFGMTVTNLANSVWRTSLALAASFAGGFAAQYLFSGLPVLAGQAYPERIVARRFVMVDSGGKVLAALQTEAGRSGLVFYDRNGQPRAALGIEGQSSGFTLFDGRGKPRITTALTSTGEPLVSLYDGDGLNRGELHIDRGGAPALAMRDARGQTRLLLGITPGGLAGIALYDQEGKDRGELRVARDGGALLSFHGGFGETLLAVGAEQSKPGIALYNRDGKLVAGLPQAR